MADLASTPPVTKQAHRLVLDTLTTRFLMLFILMLGIPMFSILGFCLNLLHAFPLLQQQFIQGMLPLVVISLLLTVGIAFWASRSITQPLLQLIESVNQIRLSREQLNSFTIEQTMDTLIHLNGVHEIRQLARAFTRMFLRLQEEETLRDDFIATLTHDLKVPLLAEKQTLDYFYRQIYGPTTELQQEVLEVLQSTNRSSLSLVSGLLEVNRYNAGNVRLLLQPVDLPSLLNEVLKELAPLALEKNQTMVCLDSLPEDGCDRTLMNADAEKLPGNLEIWADPVELKRVLINLLNNAIINTPAFGHIQCQCWTIQTLVKHAKNLRGNQLHNLTGFQQSSLNEPLTLSHNQVVFSIQDCGVGFSGEDMKRLFQRFSANRGRNPLGTGLGLFNAYQVITAHHGHLWVESTEGEGSAVNFCLPRPLEITADRRGTLNRRKASDRRNTLNAFPESSKEAAEHA